MKRFAFLLVALLGLATMVHAQNPAHFVSEHNLSKDTVTDTGTIYMYSPLLGATSASTTTIVVVIDTLSGTTAGTLTIYGSHDGVVWVTIPTPNTQTASTTATVTDTTNKGYAWVLAGSPFPRYRVGHVGSGTMSCTIRATIYRARVN